MMERNPSRIVFSTGAVFAAFIVLVLTFVFSSLYVLQVAGKSANKLKLHADQKTMSLLLQQELADLAQRQSEVAWWDATVEALGEEIDAEFFDEALLEWFPRNYDIDRSAIIEPTGTVVRHAINDSFVDGEQANAFIAQTSDLIAAAQESYFNLRVGEDGEFWIEENPLRGPVPLYVADFRWIDGQFGLVAAQAIIPDGDLTLGDGPAHIMVVFRAMTPERIRHFGTTFDFMDIAFEPAPPIDNTSFLSIASQYASQSVFVSWRSGLPDQGIWQGTLPALAAMLCAISSVMLLVTIAYSRLVGRTRAAEARNRYLANYDSLTDLANRNYFDCVLQKTIKADTLRQCAVICIDLDHFKPVNDTYGHQAGDYVIKTAAQRVKNIVGTRGTVARLGGDEFIALLTDGADKDEITMLCDNLIDAICAPINYEGQALCVGASVGIAWWPDDAQTADLVVRSADQALYRAKELGRGRVVRADELPTQEFEEPAINKSNLSA